VASLASTTETSSGLESEKSLIRPTFRVLRLSTGTLAGFNATRHEWYDVWAASNWV